MAPRSYNALGLIFVLMTACLQGCTASLYVTRIDPISGDASVIRRYNTPLHGKVDYYLPRGVITLNGTAALARIIRERRDVAAVLPG